MEKDYINDRTIDNINKMISPKRKRLQPSSPFPAKKQKANFKIVDGLRWYYKENEVPPLQKGQTLFSRDEQGAKSVYKMFCVSTWAEIHPKIVHGFNRQEYKSYYEPKME